MSNVKTYKVDEPYIKLDCELGEAPYWEELTNTLRFFDIHKEDFHTIDLNIGPSSHRIIASPRVSISTSANVEGRDDVIAFGGKHGYGLLNRSHNSTRYISRYIKRVWSSEEVEKGFEHRLRGNDGAIDSRGRYWLGMMNDPRTDPETKPEGKLFRLDPDGTLHTMLGEASIPNGLSWSGDDKLLYFTDTVNGCIEVFDYESESGAISNRRDFYRYDGTPEYEGQGAPDGHAQDEHGNLWIALCGGGRVIQVSPEGTLQAQIILPTRMPTCPVFCGNTLYITSTQEEQPEKYPDSAAVSGSLFACQVGVSGKRPNLFKWKGSFPATDR